MTQMYVEFPSGTAYPDGYIAECEVLYEIPGWVKVVLRPAPPRHRHSWSQWVRKARLFSEDDVE